MANIKFSDFTANATIVQADHFLVGFDDDDRNAGANPKNNKWTFSEVADGLIGVTAKPYSIYAADGTIGADRIVTIANTGNIPYSVNFKGNSGAAGAGPVFIQIENERVDAAYNTNSGAQLRLKGGSSSGSLNTDLDIIAHGSNYGGSSSPQVHFNSNRGYTFTAGTGGSVDYGVSRDLVLKSGSTGQITISTTTNFGNNTNTTIAMAGGGGSSSSMIQMGKSGDDIGKFFRGSANGVLQIGKHSGGAYGTAGTTTTEIYIDGSSNVGIGDNTTLTEKLHINGNCIITGQAYTEQHDQTDLTISWNNSNVVYATLTTGTILFDPSDAKSGATYILYLRQPASGGPTLINWNSLVLWPGGTPPTLSTAAGATDVITLIYNGTGTKYYGTSVLNFS